MKYLVLLLLTVLCYTASADQVYTYTNVDVKWNADVNGGNVSISKNPVIRTNTTDQSRSVFIENAEQMQIREQHRWPFVDAEIKALKAESDELNKKPDWYEGWTERHPDQKEKKHKRSHVVTRKAV